MEACSKFPRSYSGLRICQAVHSLKISLQIFQNNYLFIGIWLHLCHAFSFCKELHETFQKCLGFILHFYKIPTCDRNGLLIENANRGVTFEGSLELKYNVAARESRQFFMVMQKIAAREIKQRRR